MIAGPLQGVRVLEFSQVIAAPFAGQFLAELGAYVTKVEPPEGESWRLQMMFAPKESGTYQGLNRGKNCITLRLTSEQAQSIVHRLVKDVDVVLINYRPDVPAKFRIDYDTLRAIKPDLIYGDLTAFGRRGPWAMRPGYDGVVQAMTGLMSGEAKLREDGSPSTPSSTAIAGRCFYRAYVAADGGAVFLGAQSRPMRDRVRKAWGTDFLLRDDPNHDSEDPELQARCVEFVDQVVPDMGSRTTAEWLETLEQCGVPSGEVAFPEDVGAREQVRVNGYVVNIDHPLDGHQLQVAPLARFGCCPDPDLRPSPRLGEHTSEILDADV